MKKAIIFFAGVAIATSQIHSQTSGGASAGGGQGGTGAGASVQTGAGAGQNQAGGATVQTPNGATIQTPNGNASVAPGLPPREQLPGRAAQNPAAANGLGISNGIAISNQFAFSNRFGMSNQFGMGSNRFGFTNRFGFGSNRFGMSNEFGFRTNRFGFTNRFGGGTNRFDFTNRFGDRSNRFRFTNGLAGSNQFSLTNEIAISNSLELSNGLGFVPSDFIPGVGGGVAVAPGAAGTAAAPTQPGTPNVTPTGEPGVANRLYPSAGTIITNRTGVALQDRTVTENDRALLLSLKQAVVPRLETMGAWGPAIHFWVQDGIVRIVGAVQTPELKQEAAHLAELIPGVTAVENRLFVGNVDPNASDVDRELQYRLRETVLPQIAPNGEAPPVDFAVRNGVVTITGRAATADQAAQVAALVQQVPGVKRIRNDALTESNGAVLASPELSPATTNLPATGREQTPAAAPQPNPSGTQPNESNAPVPQNDQQTAKPQ